MVPLQDSFWTEQNAWSSSQGNDCWLYCDGEAYFNAFIKACEQARATIFILGWDIHTQTNLQPKKEPPGCLKDWSLVAFLHRILQKQTQLHIYLLTWRPAPLYVLEREKLQNLKFMHPRLHYRADAHHPVGGSHHQKIVVIDDQLAFAGGIDLTIRRWDSCLHAAGDPLRKDPDGHYYQPYHDTQIGVSGPAAGQLASLFRQRWKQVTAQTIPLSRPSPVLPRKTLDGTEAIASFVDTPVSISVTDPGFRNAPPAKQIARLYEDLLLRAQKYIFIETQYLTSHHVVELLCELGHRAEGPEIVLILPERLGPWLEKKTMSHLQAIALAEVLAHDDYGRVNIFYPFDRELLPIHKYITVHSKLMVVDDEFLTLGSANLNNRSMGLDTECNVTIDARGRPELQKAIRQTVAYIVAHYANHKADYAFRKMEKAGSLLPLIHSLRMISPYKHLADFKIQALPEECLPWLDAELLDMDRPSTLEVALDRWGRMLETVQHHLKIPPRMITFVMTGLAGAGIAASHVLMDQPLHPGLDLSVWAPIEDTQLSGLLLIPAVYLVACLVFAPINLLILMAAGFFPSMLALPYIILGVIALICVGYATGRTLGRMFFPDFYGRHHPGDLAALFLLQVMPIAPHTLVNAAAGAAGVPFFRFMLATLVGMMPGCIMLIVFQRSIIKAFMDPGWKTFLPLLLFIVLVSGVFRWSSQRFSNYGSRQAPQHPSDG
ncbi:phospholipase D-like domain-containing protein [Oligoflexus tunisiensis]|uniref:phospholipase D-like domain-containing protein n=1 Tax=Oligoflexus tunisiensis TaxID=708132 RepID=UPI00159F125E|nr:phospholipase D-like domain-containing protein [Oligoflexus tunisiensis]